MVGVASLLPLERGEIETPPPVGLVSTCSFLDTQPKPYW